MTLTEREVFQRALSFVRDPDRLLQDGDMWDRGGPNNELRCCSVGWLGRVSHHTLAAVNTPIRDALDDAAMLAGYTDGGIFDFNDTETHANVVALWERVGRERGWL